MPTPKKRDPILEFMAAFSRAVTEEQKAAAARHLYNALGKRKKKKK